MHWYVSYLYSCRLVWTACLSTASITLKNYAVLFIRKSMQHHRLIHDESAVLPLHSKTSRGTQGMGDETREQVLDELILQLLAGFGSVGVSWWITLISRGLLWTLICRESALHVWIPCEDAGAERCHVFREVLFEDAKHNIIPVLLILFVFEEYSGQFLEQYCWKVWGRQDFLNDFESSVFCSLSLHLFQSSVSHDPSEIILICWFTAQETLLIIIRFVFI